MRNTKEHVAVPVGFIHLSIQDTITMKTLLKKGLPEEEVIRELPVYVQEEAKKIYERG